MPMRLRAARASAMIRVLPSSNSLIFMGPLPRNFTCGILCASSPRPHATDVSPRRPGPVFRVTVLSGGFLTLRDPEQRGSACRTAFDLDHELDAHLESVLVAQGDSEV